MLPTTPHGGAAPAAQAQPSPALMTMQLLVMGAAETLYAAFAEQTVFHVHVVMVTGQA